MCLIITKPAGVTFDDKFLRSTYEKNKDGIGVMYAEGNVLYSAKQVPRSFADIKAFWDTHVGDRECVVHFRMQTHGDIDLTNCHPYEVLSSEDGYPLYLIHNGILHTDNLNDTSKSDTWHYIQDYLRPMLLKNPEFFMTPAFSEIIGEHIGTGNKFVLLDAYGNIVTVNKDQGVEYNGAWLSNTYAWDTAGTEYDFRSRYKGFGKGNARGRYAGIHETDDDFWGAYGATYPSTATKPVETKDAQEDYADPQAEVDDFFDALVDTMIEKGMDANLLSYAGVQDYYEYYGEDAYVLVELVDSGTYDEQELLDELRVATVEAA